MRINDENYKEFLLRYMEEDLTAEELAEVDGFIDEEPVAIQELRALERTKAKPDMNIVFPHKARLKKEETEAPVRKLMWYTARAASIAAMLVIAILFHNEFAGNDQNQAMYYSAEEVNANINGLQDEDIAGEMESFDIDFDSESSFSFEKNTQVAGIVPVNIFKNTSVKQVKSETETRPTEENNSTKDKPKSITAGQNLKHDAKLSEVSREQVQTALNLLKNKTVAYKEASQFSMDADEYFKKYPSRKQSEKMVKTAVLNDEVASAESDDEIKTPILVSAINNIFKKHVSLKKKKQEDHQYYALTIETPGIKISKSFRANN